ncbi:MAG: sugar kinase [Fusicatenibacter sp.]|nr:sugar kinase [Lachnospiraceae bacterium]MDY2939167.1 sugar kinase [Fusicatenibacter sp.]
MRVLTFGELLLRLKTPEYLRILQSDNFEASYGGAESNVAVSLAMLRDEVSFLTKIPDNPVGLAALNEVRRYGVDTSGVVFGGSRLGIYYFEKGSNIRPTTVLYDREHSAFAEACEKDFAWDQILKDVDVFYFSGVTPAVSDSVERAVREALKYCREHSIYVVCDLNYRSKMWSTEKAQKVMGELMNWIDLCIANDEDFESALGIPAFDGDMAHGIDQIDTYREGMKEITRRYPNCKAVASVLRNMRTVEDGDWMGIYYTGGRFYESPVHTVHSLEAVGAGDAFAGALLHGIVRGFAPQKVIDFSIAASVMKLMIQHDFNVVSEAEILKIMKTNDVNLQR